MHAKRRCHCIRPLDTTRSKSGRAPVRPMRMILLMLVLVSLAGCLDEAPATDVDDAAPTPYEPLPNLPFEGNLTRFGSGLVVPLPGSGQGIWIHDDTLYWTNGGDLVLVDVTDPLDAKQLGTVEIDGGARDVDVLRWADRTWAVLAGSGDGVHLVDVTDREAPIFHSTIPLPSAGVHNLAAVPDTPYIYSSGASGQTKRIDVLDITDPETPLVHTFPIPAMMGGVPVESDGCHDITVRVDLERAYCAGGGGTYAGLGGESFIWDISEDAGGPTAPRWVAMIDDPRIKYHHQALANDDGTILVLDDEHIVANNCVREDVGPLPGDLDPQIPTGAAWIYDVSDEANPVLRSIVQNPTTYDDDFVPNVNCGSHFGDMVLGQEAFIMGWYSGGTLLVGFDDPSEPQILDILPTDESHWDARYWRGHVYHSGTDLVITQLT